MKRKRKYSLIILSPIVIVLALTIWANSIVNKTTMEFIFSNLKDVKPNNVGLLLGTSRNLKNGAKNDFFFNRIDATVELYKSGKIKNIIISGDNSKTYYNEPSDMKEELIKNGIPESVIYLDYAGFRTLDAVVRARDIFGQNSFLFLKNFITKELSI